MQVLDEEIPSAPAASPLMESLTELEQQLAALRPSQSEQNVRILDCISVHLRSSTHLHTPAHFNFRTSTPAHLHISTPRQLHTSTSAHPPQLHPSTSISAAREIRREGGKAAQDDLLTGPCLAAEQQCTNHLARARLGLLLVRRQSARISRPHLTGDLMAPDLVKSLRTLSRCRIVELDDI